MSETLNALIEELEGQLSIEPSTGFRSRVRAGVAAERQSWFNGWRLVAVVTASAVVLASWWSLARVTEPVAPTPPSLAAAVRSGRPAGVAPPVPSVVTANAGGRATVSTPARAAATESRGPIERTDPEVLTDQPDVLRRLWQRASLDSRAAPTAVEMPPDVLGTSTDPIRIPTITYESIEVQQIRVDQRAMSAGGLPVVRRIRAADSTRSVK
jgi:hypothetical protein